MKAATEKKLISGIVIAIVSVLAILAVFLFQSARMQDTSAAIKHTNQVLSQVHDIVDLSQQYELGVKNFLLTGDSVFLDSAGRLKPRLLEKFVRLKILTAGDPLGQIDVLLEKIRSNQKVLEEAARLSRSNNFSGVAQLIGTGASTGYSHQIHLITSQIETDQQLLLEERRRANQRRALELQSVLWILIAAVVVLALVTFQKVRIDLIKEKEAREQLNRNNQELEEKVRFQTRNLQASQEKYKTLFYKSPLPKWIYDLETLKFLEVNDAAIQSYGYSQEEFLRMTIADIRPPEDMRLLQEDIERVRAVPGESNSTTDWRHVKKNGEVIFVELTAHPIEYEHRKARMVVMNDVSELKKRATELMASNAELERFAYIASHDLQEPLRMVSSFLQLLQKKYKGQLDEKADQYIHYAVDGAERMRSLIMDLLEYSRVGTGRESFESVDTAVVLSEIGEVFRSTIIATRARIEIGAMPKVWGDKVQVTQLFQNLVGNALKYHSDRPPVIRIGGKEGAGYWEFFVEDNGIGIDPLFFDKIFIIFQRLHNKSDYSGTGIGLAICKKIVERHGGKIWVESVAGQGSTFFFTIVKQP